MHAKDYNYLNKNDITIKNVDDKKDFKRTMQAMTEAGIPLNEQLEIFRVCAGILFLGNIKFKALNQNNEEGSEIENLDILKRTAMIFGLDEEPLKNALIYRIMTIGKDVTKKPQKPESAENNRDALAKGIYERLFLKLVRRINESIKRPDDARSCIGVLDIYGFEIYKNVCCVQFSHF